MSSKRSSAATLQRELLIAAVKDHNSRLKFDRNSVDTLANNGQGDLWARIRKGFQLTDLDGDLVQNQLNWYTTRPDYVQRMTDRSQKYLYHIVAALEARHMPTEL